MGVAENELVIETSAEEAEAVFIDRLAEVIFEQLMVDSHTQSYKQGSSASPLE